MQQPKIKMYCIFAESSVGTVKNRGKLGTQAGHAYLHTAMSADPAVLQAYLESEHRYKITLVVPTVDDLYKLQEKYSAITSTHLVKDAGITVFNMPTVTCLGIGPISEDQIDTDVSTLKLFK